MVEKVLNRLLELLTEERKELITSIKDNSAVKNLDKIREEKEKILTQIKDLDKKDVEKYLDLIEKIDRESKINQELALNNITFIDKLFEALFKSEKTEQYNKDGIIKNQNKQNGLLNKKV